MYRLFSHGLIKSIVLILSVSLVLSFPVISFGADNTDPDIGEQDPSAASLSSVSETDQDTLDQDGTEELLPDENDPVDDPIKPTVPDSVSSDPDDGVDVESEETVNAMNAPEDPDGTDPEEPAEDDEVIVIEYQNIILWANRKYTLKQPKTGLLPVTKWMTSNQNVASVSGEGVITALNVGTATVNGFDENSRLRKSVTVTVKLGRDYTLFVAHKGYCAVAPENTLPAFRRAVRAGFGGIEFDVWESKTTAKSATPCILVVHDKNLKKKTGKKMKAYKLNRKNRSKYKIRKNVKGLKKYGPQLIPTLEESLNCIYAEAKAKGVKNFVVEIDIKNSMSDRAVKHIIKKVGKHHVHIISSSHKVLKKFKKYRKYKSTELWYCTDSNVKTKRSSNIKKAGAAGFDGISIPYRNMSKDTIKLAKSYGMEIGGYGIQEPAYIQKWVKAGCTRFNINDKVFL